MKPIKGKYKKIFFTPAVLVLIMAFSIVVWRSANLSITHDEALTINYFVPKPYFEILGGGQVDGLYANNHPLNTALEKLTTSIFGISEFSVRLPALLGFLMYLASSYFIVSSFFKKWWQKTISLIFLDFHPFLIDYFSAARGYALSLGLLILGVSLTIKSIKSGISRNYKLSEVGLLLGALSATNNLNFLHPFMAMLACQILIYFFLLRSGKQTTITLLIRDLFLSLFPLLLVYAKNFMTAYKTGAFYVGGKSFWQDTLTSLVNVTAYKFVPRVSYITIALFFILSVIIGLWPICKSKQKINFYVASLLILSSLSVYLSNKLLRADVVVERGAIFFIPLYSLFLFAIWNSINKKVNLAFLKGAIIGIIFITDCYFLTSIQTSDYYTWPYDRNTKEAFKAILDDYQKNSKSTENTIGATWLFEPALNFYRTKYAPNNFAPITRETTNSKYDYYYLLSNFDNHGRIENLEEIKKTYNLKTLKYFDNTTPRVLLLLI